MWAKEVKGIREQNLVVSASAHLAFERACRYYGIECRIIDVKKDFNSDLNAMLNAADSNTIALVASACDFAYGIIDPVKEMG